MFIVVKSLIIYLILTGIFTIIFGLLVLNDEDKWYISILKMLFMPFLVIIGFILAILEDKMSIGIDICDIIKQERLKLVK